MPVASFQNGLGVAGMGVAARGGGTLSPQLGQKAGGGGGWRVQRGECGMGGVGRDGMGGGRGSVGGGWGGGGGGVLAFRVGEGGIGLRWGVWQHVDHKRMAGKTGEALSLLAS